MTIISDEIRKTGCPDRIITLDVEHDGIAFGIGFGWPPPFSGGVVDAAEGISSLGILDVGVFIAINAFLSFRTNLLPRSFEVKEATIKLRLTWGETIEAADYSAGSFPGLDGLVPISEAIPLVGKDLEFPVRPNSVLRRKHDPSQFRLTITGGQPNAGADNRIEFFNGGFSDRSIVPRLECRLRGCQEPSGNGSGAWPGLRR